MRRALELVEGLRSEHPDAADYTELRLECLMKLGGLLETSKQPDATLSTVS